MAANQTRGDFLVNVLTGGWLLERKRTGAREIPLAEVRLVREGVELGLRHAMDDYDRLLNREVK